MNHGISAYEITGTPKETNAEINENLFSHIDFGPLKAYLDDDNITDISYSNNGQVWLKSLDKGVYRIENPGIDNELMEKIAFQCANIMGKVFNMASPFLDSESSELRMNFVHDSVARNGIAAVFRKTPAKIRLKKEKIIADKYITVGIHDFLIDCVKGHCNIIVCGETGSGKTELVKYLASHTAENEKIVTIEDTLELHLDRIYPNRDIVAMKTNNIASYSDVLVTCMRQNPKWILLSEVRSAEAVTAVRNSISSGHNILSTIHADKAQSIPYRLYSLLESNIDVEQFMTTIYRYIQIGIHVRARYDHKTGGFMREVSEVCEFHVTRDNVPEAHTIYRKNIDGTEIMNAPSEYLLDYLESQGVDIKGKEYTKEFSETNKNVDMFNVEESTKTENPTASTSSENIQPTVSPVASSTDNSINTDSINNTNSVNTNSANTANTIATQPSSNQFFAIPRNPQPEVVLGGVSNASVVNTINTQPVDTPSIDKNLNATAANFPGVVDSKVSPVDNNSAPRNPQPEEALSGASNANVVNTINTQTVNTPSIDKPLNATAANYPGVVDSKASPVDNNSASVNSFSSYSLDATTINQPVANNINSTTNPQNTVTISQPSSNPTDLI